MPRYAIKQARVLHTIYTEADDALDAVNWARRVLIDAAKHGELDIVRLPDCSALRAILRRLNRGKHGLGRNRAVRACVRSQGVEEVAVILLLGILAICSLELAIFAWGSRD